MLSTSAQPATASVAQTIGEYVTVFVGPAVLVSSKSKSGEFHTVLGGSCSCVGFQYRGTCSHLAVAIEAQERDRESARSVEPPARTLLGGRDWCIDCGCAQTEIGVRCQHCHDVYWADGTMTGIVNYTPGFAALNPAPSSESDAAKLGRWQRSLEYLEAKPGRSTNIQASHLRRMIVKLARQMEGGR